MILYRLYWSSARLKPLQIASDQYHGEYRKYHVIISNHIITQDIALLSMLLLMKIIEQFMMNAFFC